MSQLCSMQKTANNYLCQKNKSKGSKIKKASQKLLTHCFLSACLQSTAVLSTIAQEKNGEHHTSALREHTVLLDKKTHIPLKKTIASYKAEH